MGHSVPNSIIGYRKDGRPIRLIAGGSGPPGEPVNPPSPNVAPTSSGTSNPPVPMPPSQYFTADQLERARQEEKDKLYDRLKKSDDQLTAFKSQVDELTADKKARDDEAARVQAEADEAKRKAEEDKLSAQQLVEKARTEMAAEMENLRTQQASDRALMEKERQFLTLQSYIQRRISEEVGADNIHPTFVDYINGNNEAEVEASITIAKEKTDSILEGIVNRQPVTGRPGVSPTGFGPSGPLDNLTGTPRAATPEEIQAMDMDQYAAYRRTAGIDKAGNDRGMFR